MKDKNLREDGSSKLDGINDNTYELLFVDRLVENQNDYNYTQLKAFVTIDEFTKKQEKNIFKKLLRKKYSDKIIDFNKIMVDSDTGIYEYRDGELVMKDMANVIFALWSYLVQLMVQKLLLDI